MQNSTLYDITSTQANVNAYNRYPFTDISEAIHYAKEKSLQPGELAICYYFDPDTIVGINAIIVIGNLRKNGNIIFQNASFQLDKFKYEVCQDLAEVHDENKHTLDMVNYNNKIVSDNKAELNKLREEIKLLEDKIKSIDKI